MTRTIVLLRI